MNAKFPESGHTRQAIAIAAARLIAESGHDYASARHKAVSEMLGGRAASHLLPSHAEIEAEVRLHHALFAADTQPARLLALRGLALTLLNELAVMEPLVYGGVVNGTAGEHSHIHLLLFPEDPKAIDYWLLNRNVAFDPVAVKLGKGRMADGIAFRWHDEWVEAGVLQPHQRRGLLKAPTDQPLFRTDARGLQALLTEAAV
ncbi:MAG: hypothetical protein ACK5NY_06645 [Burkholderiaceae bacterium]|jgi:hypothetical protein